MTQEDLEGIARKLVKKPKGILAMDESSGTIKQRFESVGLENTAENRRAYREMLITTPSLGEYISGVILFTETLNQKTSDGKPFVEILKEEGIIVGVKVDLGTRPYPNFPDELVTDGIDGLAKRIAEYTQQGAKFAKCRAVFSIYGNERPTKAVINANAQRFGEYAPICQNEGLVPIVEPEVLMDGSHSLEDCMRVTYDVLSMVFNKLLENRINFKAMILKTNIVVPGNESKVSYSPDEVAEKTVRVLKSTVPEDIPGIAFLSGDLSDEDATTYLNVMNQRYAIELPWNLTFSFNRGLTREPRKIWAQGGPDNFKNAQRMLLQRAKETSLATEGKYQA